MKMFCLIEFKILLFVILLLLRYYGKMEVCDEMLY